VCADAGGSNGYRVRLWKLELAILATEIGLPIMVCHLPPGTSKWNKIEHRLFSAITGNWRGRPLTSHEVVVELIGATTTRTGLTVHAEVDTRVCPAESRSAPRRWLPSARRSSQTSSTASGTTRCDQAPQACDQLAYVLPAQALTLLWCTLLVASFDARSIGGSNRRPRSASVPWLDVRQPAAWARPIVRAE